MQEQRGAMGSFSETLGFEHGSTSSDVVNSPSNRLPDCMSLNPASQEEENLTMWTVGEPGSSSGPSQSNQSHNEPRPDRGWPSLMKSCPEPSSSALSLGDRGSSSSSFSDPFGPSSDPFELEARQVSRKRKAVELSIGQSSSGVGSSNLFQRSEGGPSSWRTVSEDPPSDPTIPRLGLSIGEHSVRENAHRNVDPLPGNNNNQESDVSVLRLNLSVENSISNSNSSSLQSQLGLRVPALRRNLQSTREEGDGGWSSVKGKRVQNGYNGRDNNVVKKQYINVQPVHQISHRHRPPSPDSVNSLTFFPNIIII
ncbi:uncharacterized protein LOC110932429 [Helianthus annuus]|uniref:uncharacterized protein LOC110932429 n=1 Tax=Helianthus annuus TaxID=4232 RepID=UPI000B905067|nr:uncharacterized protein LOC110932429 [Helianthus annuus]